MTNQTIDQDPAEATLADDLGALLQSLTALPGGAHQVLSCYVQLGVDDRARGSHLIRVKDGIKALRADPMMTALGHEARAAVERDLDRVVNFLSRPSNLPAVSGVAIFACEGLGLFTAAPLVRVHRTRIILDDTPWITELAAAEHEAQPILAVVADRTHARFFEVTTRSVAELACLAASGALGGKFHSSRGDAPGWNEQAYHNRLEHERHRHYANIQDEIQNLLRTRPFRGFILAGPNDHVAGLTRFLPHQISAHLLGTAKLNPTAVQTHELQRATLAAAEEHDRAAQTAELKALDDAVGSGWAVNGPRESLRALHSGQARTLFIREGLEGRGYRCSATGRLVLAQGDCRGEGTPLPVRDLVDEAIEEALRQKVQVVLIPDNEAATVVDGLAAILRFR